MAFQKGTPQSPLIMTLDGGGFYLMESKLNTAKGVPHIDVILEPFEWCIEMLNLKDELDKSESSYGWLRRSFPLSSRIIVSENPSKPIWWILEGINGDKINWDKPQIAPLIEMKQEIDQKNRRIIRLELERDELQKENIKLIKKSKELKNEYEKIYGQQTPQFLPQELIGTIINKEGIKR